MSLIQCPECGKEKSEQAKACPHCGASKPKSRLWLKLLIGVPTALFLLMMVIGSNAPNADAKSADRRAIDMCWKDQSKKSLDPGAARFVAGACEKMEADFRQRFGVSP